MVKIFIIFLIAIFALALLAAAAFSARNRDRLNEIDRQYYDEDGNHLYYDRSIIEKEDFRRNNPEEEKNIRTLRRLFRKEKK
ncbi:MAG: hypothetical protein K2J82_01410 [Muribaculaceae bacterium]|nr:hypothetical protein [Muribaculaceae bacterium]MDE6753251.1 hypothetical protein [Muribaculaceae bacterium]